MKWVWRHQESVKSLGELLGSTGEPDWMSSLGRYLILFPFKDLSFKTYIYISKRIILIYNIYYFSRYIIYE